MQTAVGGGPWPPCQCCTLPARDDRWIKIKCCSGAKTYFATSSAAGKKMMHTGRFEAMHTCRSPDVCGRARWWTGEEVSRGWCSGGGSGREKGDDRVPGWPSSSRHLVHRLCLSVRHSTSTLHQLITDRVVNSTSRYLPSDTTMPDLPTRLEPMQV